MTPMVPVSAAIPWDYKQSPKPEEEHDKVARVDTAEWEEAPPVLLLQDHHREEKPLLVEMPPRS